MGLNLGELALRLGVDDQITPGLNKTERNINDFRSRAVSAAKAASAAVLDARKGEQNAARQVAIAEQRLAEIRAGGKAKTSQVLAAEDRLERARQTQASATAKVTDATRKETAALAAASQARARGADGIEEVGAAADRSQGAVLRLAGKAGLGLLAYNAVKTGIDTASGMETARMGFTTMLKSAQLADGFLKQLADFAAKTPFEFPELQTAAQSLISAGVEADKVIPIMRTLGDVTAGMGTGAEGVQRATIAIQQMNAAGRITGEDLNQLRDAGIPVYDLLAAATGRSTAEVIALAQAGKLGKTELDAMMKALQTGAGLERFNGLMEQTSTSLSGLWSTLQDTFSQGMASAIQPAIPLIKMGLGGAIALISDHLDEAIFAAGAFFAVWSVQKIGVLVGSLSEMTVGFGKLSASLGKASAFLGGPWGIAIGLAVTVLGALVAKHYAAVTAAKAFTDTLTFQNGVLDKNSASLEIDKLAKEGALETAKKAGIAESDYVTALIKGGSSRQQMIDQLQSIADRHTVVTMTASGAQTRLDGVGIAAKEAAEKLQTEGAALDGSARAAKLADSATKGLSASTSTAADKSQVLASAQADLQKAEDKLRSETQKLIDKFTILRDGSLGSERATAAFEESLDAAKAAVKENGKSLDVHSEKGRANRAVITEMITSLNDKVAADFKSNVETKGLAKATDIASAALKTGKARILESAGAAGYNTGKVKSMQDRMLQTPKELRTQVNTPGIKAAQDNVKRLGDKIHGLDNKSVFIRFDTNAYKIGKTKFSVNLDAPSSVGRSATGGKISGPGSGTSDSILGLDMLTGRATSWVSNGEFVTNERQYNRNKSQVETINAGGDWDLIPRHAGGGTVGRTVSAQADPVPTSMIQFVNAADWFEGAWARGAGQKLGNAYARGLQQTSTVKGGGYAKALDYARAHAGHPYVFGTLWDCSGFMSALQSIILGQSPHRRYSTPAFHGDHAQGFTRNKRSAFMVGVRPLAGKLGHMAGTLNGVNVESAGGVGVRVGKSARGWNNPMFSWRGGLAAGGPVGDLPFDLLDPSGERYDPRLRHRLFGYSGGTNAASPGFAWTAEKKAELVVNPQFRKYKGGEQVLNGEQTEQLFSDAARGKSKEWTADPMIGEYHQHFPQSMDPMTAAALAGSMTVAKLGAINIRRS